MDTAPVHRIEAAHGGESAVSMTTGPVLAIGAVTMVNQSVFHDRPVDWRVPIATGLLAVGFTLFERIDSKTAQIFAWTGLVAVLVSRMDPSLPSPAESALQWWNKQN